MIEAADEVLQKQFPDAGGRVAGIDPGRKVALSLSTPDGGEKKIIQPSLARNKGFLRKLRRLQRKADRQRRAGSPDCYDAQNRWIKGKRLGTPSENLQETERTIAEMQRHLADARLDFYHRTANDLLTRYDVVGVGKWRGRGNAPGEGKSQRAQNRKDYDHAISLFVGVLRYKAGDDKHVFDIPEHGSTRDCLKCKAPTGPTGLAGLKVRQWTCPRCGTVHERDFASACTHAQRAVAILAAGAQPPCSQPARKGGKLQRRRSPKDQTKVAPPEGAGVPVGDEAEAVRPATRKRIPSAACAAVPEQEPGGVRASETPVAPGDSNYHLAWSRPATGLRPRTARRVLGGQLPLRECYMIRTGWDVGR